VTGAGVLRLVAVSSCGLLIGLTGMTFYVYLLAWHRFPHRRGLIPRYVVGVSTYVILVEILFIVLIDDLLDRDAPLAVYGPLIMVGNGILLVSLLSIFRFERRRVNAATTAIPDHSSYPARRAEDLAPPERTWWGWRSPPDAPKQGDP
jgi:hypothetical protein